MSELLRQRCFRHASREAAARCPQCGRFFCRECVTEHAGRVICASCLKALTGRPGRRAGRLAALRRLAERTVQCAVGLLVAWTFFYFLGRLLLQMPASFHDGTVWRDLLR